MKLIFLNFQLKYFCDLNIPLKIYIKQKNLSSFKLCIFIATFQYKIRNEFSFKATESNKLLIIPFYVSFALFIYYFKANENEQFHRGRIKKYNILYLVLCRTKFSYT